jgi:hypothetical protein
MASAAEVYKRRDPEKSAVVKDPDADAELGHVLSIPSFT